MLDVHKIINEQGILDIVHPNMAELSRTDNTMFAMVRRSGLGATMRLYNGCKPMDIGRRFNKEKQSIGYTDHEREVSEKKMYVKEKT